MKILQAKYPKGSFPYQQSDGRYIDGMLYENLSILSEVIIKDMTFLGIVSSSTLEVGTGKSVLCQQIGEAWHHLMKEKHNIELPDLSMKNIIFKPKDIIERAFQVPKYSMLIVDEWEDAHYWSELGVSLRKFFRKCRQLNLFMLIIIPNFFQLPASYAISRSVFFIDVRFEGKFERGYFRFFNFEKKKDLYIHGKKEQNYKCVEPNFSGRFTDGYAVNEKEYRAAKLKDLAMEEEEDRKPTPKEIRDNIIMNFKKNCPNLAVSDICKGFGISRTQYYRVLGEQENCNNPTVALSTINPMGNGNDYEQPNQDADNGYNNIGEDALEK